MSKSGPVGIRRAVLCTVCKILITGLFLSGLVWMTSLRERGWSKDPQTFGRQVTFVVTLVAIVFGAFAVNQSLNRRRDRSDLSTASEGTSSRPQSTDDPLRDPLLDR
jgi:hypothetical protein